MRRRKNAPRGVFVSGLDPQLWSAIRELAKSEGLTLSALVASALLELLRAHTKEVH